MTVFLFVEPLEVASWLANPDVLLGLILLNVFLAAMRLFSTEHAWWAGGGHRWFAALFLAAIVAIPHVAVGWVGMETRDSLLKVFSTPKLIAAATTTTSSTTTTTQPVELSPIVIPPGQLDEDPITATKTAPWEPFGQERLNVLLLGGDAGPGRRGLRTDTMIVASIDPISGATALIGIPRNFGDPRLTDGTEVPVRILNAVYGWGTRNPEAFGGVDPGAAAVAEAVAYITGLEVDYFAMVDLTGFAAVVDVLGGVRVEVAEPVDGPLYDPATGGYEMVQIPNGTQTLDGGHALAYARARYGSSDYARMARQRCILAALAGQADPMQLLTSLPDLLAVVEENLTTDMPLELVPELVRLLFGISATNISVIGFDGTWGHGRSPEGYTLPDVDRIREVVRQTIEDPANASGLGVATAGEACG